MPTGKQKASGTCAYTRDFRRISGFYQGISLSAEESNSRLSPSVTSDHLRRRLKIPNHRTLAPDSILGDYLVDELATSSEVAEDAEMAYSDARVAWMARGVHRKNHRHSRSRS